MKFSEMEHSSQKIVLYDRIVILPQKDSILGQNFVQKRRKSVKTLSIKRNKKEK